MASASPIWGIVLIVSAVSICMVTLRGAQVLFDLSPETSRKLFHLVSGAIALSLPWLFDELWPVVMLYACGAAGFLLLRTIPRWRNRIGQVIHAVPRESAGEQWFLAGVLAVFGFAHDNILHYSIAIIVLAVADTAAAIVGLFYGEHRYRIVGGMKSVEGSSAYFLTAFLCIHVPLLLLSDIGREETLLVAAIMAILLTLAEAIAWHGTDNFVLPVFVVLLLEAYHDISQTALLAHLLTLIALGMLVFVYRRRTTLSEDALLGTTLIGYGFWSLADWRWLIAPVTMFTTYAFIIRLPKIARTRPFHAPMVLALLAPSLVIAISYRRTDTDWLLYPFNASIAGCMAMVCVLHRRLVNELEPGWYAATIGTLTGLIVLLPTLPILDWGLETLQLLSATLLSVVLAATMFNFTSRSLRQDLTRHGAWFAAPMTVSAAILISFGALYFMTSGSWRFIDI